MHRVLSLCLAFSALLFNAGALAQDNALRVRGTVSAVAGNELTVQTAAGQSVKVQLADKHTVLLYTPLKLSDIKPNSYVAVASVPQPDGSLRAVGLAVFPEGMRGLNEGTKGWDIAPGSRMTNATLAQFVEQGKGGEVVLRYEGSKTQKVVVNENVPVSTFAPAERSALGVGSKVVVFATRQGDGSLTSGLVGVGKDGYMPPV